jgi:Uma2 family endonuclease
MKRATYEDVLNAPEDKVAEIIDGELFLTPRPGFRHARAQAATHGQLWGRFDNGRAGPGGWWLLTEPELRFGDQTVVPDIGGWRRERLPEIPDRPWLDLAPDWVCEVISPSTERIDRSRKLPAYAEARVSHAWLVNPITQTLEVLRLSDGAWTIDSVFTGSAPVRAAPFEELELDLGALWGRAPEAPPAEGA